ncbi:MAG TPA: type II toxin-antitoxin system VapC family toxin [Rhizomicrobium sp.]|nr:type II toxin-antitoxin system VapC family toxin [Rhizomicrobium sp.]
MYLLDTNIISEIRRRKPHGAVLAWLRDTPGAAMHLAAITLGELQAGVEKTRPLDRTKAAEIEAWIDELAATMKVLPADGPVFRRWAQLMHGRPDELIEDAMIAATADIHGLLVVTRNTRDFQLLGVKTFNPFEFGKA